MSSADILTFGERAGPFPRGEVLDLAVSVAIGRDLARTRAEMFGLVADWFLRPASDGEISVQWMGLTTVTKQGEALVDAQRFQRIVRVNG